MIQLLTGIVDFVLGLIAPVPERAPVPIRVDRHDPQRPRR
jgi:hypothetical protein